MSTPRLAFTFIIIAFVFVLKQPSVSAQNELDSLLAINMSQLTPKKQVDTYINISRAYYEIEDFDNGIEYGKKAIELAHFLKNDTLIAQSQFFTALSFHEIAIDSAIYYTLKAYVAFKKMNHPWLVYSIDNMALYYIQKSMFPEALKFGFEKLAYYTQLNDTLSSIDATIDIGYLYDRIEDYPMALKWHRKALQQAKNINDDYSIIKASGFIGIVYDELNLYDSAHYYNKIALEGYEKEEEWFTYRKWCSNIANTYIKQKNWNQALRYLNLSLEDETLNSVHNGIKLINLGKTYSELKNYKKAQYYLELGISNCLENKQYQFISEGYYHKSDLFANQGNYKEALSYFKLYKSYQDTVFSVQKSNQLAYMQVQFETEEKEKQLLAEQHKKQQAENKNLQLALEITSKNNLLLVSSALLISLLFGGFYWVQRNKKKLTAEKNKAIIEEKDKGLKAILTAQEEERAQVARELHDGIVQELTVIKNQLQTVIPNTTGATEIMLKKLSSDLSQASKEVRTISHQLMPLALKELGLSATIEDMLSKTLEPAAIHYDFVEIGIENRLPEKIEISLYRIAQELTNNIIKHSGADLVTVTLNNRGGFITMIVEDNGKGFSVGFQKNGIGITNINSRINLVHGELKYESSEESGTVTIVRIPLAQIN